MFDPKRQQSSDLGLARGRTAMPLGLSDTYRRPSYIRIWFVISTVLVRHSKDYSKGVLWSRECILGSRRQRHVFFHEFAPALDDRLDDLLPDVVLVLARLGALEHKNFLVQFTACNVNQ